MIALVLITVLRPIKNDNYNNNYISVDTNRHCVYYKHTAVSEALNAQDLLGGF